MSNIKPLDWIQWNGDYDKVFYDVRTKERRVYLHCWPNAGTLVCMVDSGTCFNVEDNVDIRLSKYQDGPPSKEER